ncbi:MAG: ACT domain-containing protein [Thermodesulfobacteriota bacterium]
METIAVYWESRIKTYGFQRIPDLALIEFSCHLSEIKFLGEILSQSRLDIFRPKFTMAQELDNQISFILCLPNEEGQDLWETIKKISKVNLQRYIYPVGIIFFHGPHFGDRYGIAEAMFSTLAKADVKILSSGCSSASVYLVLDQNDMDKAEKGLSETFEVAK